VVMGPESRFACPGRRGSIHFSNSHTSASSRRKAPELCRRFEPPKNRGRRECRVPAAPAASRAKVKAHERSHHRFTGASRHSLRGGFTAYSALSPVTGLSCHRRLRDTPARLTPASGRQDHTALPSASSALVSRTASVHRIPPQRWLTLRNAPLNEAGRRETYT